MRCPQCNNENPTVANFCMSCGAALRGIVNKEVTKLQNEISEITQRNAELEDDNTKFKNRLEQQQKQLSEKELEIKKLESKKGPKAPKIQSKRKGILPWIIVGSMFTIIIAFSLENDNTLSSKNQELEKIITQKTDSIRDLQHINPLHYKSVVDRCYFYDDNFNRTNRYICYGEKIKIIRIKNKFAYGIYMDGKDSWDWGWVRLGDLNKINNSSTKSK